MGRRKVISMKRPSIAMKVEIDSHVVKSAARVMEILEYFDDIQREATVGEVVKALNYPQSSTSALLRSLATLGFLHHDAHAHTYITSSRVALLGNWVNAHFFREGRVLQMMKELSERTDDTIILATRNGLHAQYIHVIQANSPARLHVTLGTVRPLAASGAGYVMLSELSDAEVTKLVNRINADAPDDRIVNRKDLLPVLADIRKTGYVMTCGLVTKGGGMLAAPLPRGPGEPLLVIGIGGINEVMVARKDELVSVLKETIARHYPQRPEPRRLSA